MVARCLIPAIPASTPIILKSQAPAAARARFFKNRHSKSTSLFCAIFIPTWLRFGFQNWSFFLILGFPRCFQNCIVFRTDCSSILAPFWRPTWRHLGSQDTLKSEKMASKNYHVASQERFGIQPCFWRPFRNVLASILGGSELNFRRFLKDFFELPGLLWECFQLLLLPKLLARFSSVLAKSAPKGIQELAEDRAEE